MTSTNLTSHILLALDKALFDNRDDLTDTQKKSLTEAVTKTIVGEPIPAEELAAVKADQINNGGRYANALRDRL